jgi:AbrB family looped-hinge helix DNA binding protein
MIVAKVTSKGQVTIPKKVREKLGVHPGEDVGFEEKNGLIYIQKTVKKSPFDKWVGRLKQLEGQQSDDLVKELRGHDNRR